MKVQTAPGKGKFSLWFFRVRVKVGFKNSEPVSRAHIWPNLSSFSFCSIRCFLPCSSFHFFFLCLWSFCKVNIMSVQSFEYNEAHTHTKQFYALYSKVLCLCFISLTKPDKAAGFQEMDVKLSAIRIFSHTILADTGWLSSGDQSLEENSGERRKKVPNTRTSKIMWWILHFLKVTQHRLLTSGRSGWINLTLITWGRFPKEEMIFQPLGFKS